MMQSMEKLHSTVNKVTYLLDCCDTAETRLDIENKAPTRNETIEAYLSKNKDKVRRKSCRRHKWMGMLAKKRMERNMM